MAHQPSSSQAAPASVQNLPEKPVAARFSTPAHATNQQPGQQQFHPVELPKTEPFKPRKPFALAKLVLGGFNLVFAIIVLGISLGVAIASFSFDSFVVVIIAAVTAVISIVWQLAEFITIAARKTRRPIHPGAHVGVHLILWILCVLSVPTLCLELYYTMDDYSVSPDCAGSSEWSNNDCSYYSFATQAAANKYFQLLEALAAFCVLMFIAHFTFFVMACVETDRRRKYGKKTKVVYLVANQGTVDGRMYYSPVAPPQHAAAGGNGADAGTYGYYAPTVPAPAQQHAAHTATEQPGTAV